MRARLATSRIDISTPMIAAAMFAIRPFCVSRRTPLCADRSAANNPTRRSEQ